MASPIHKQLNLIQGTDTSFRLDIQVIGSRSFNQRGEWAGNPADWVGLQAKATSDEGTYDHRFAGTSGGVGGKGNIVS